MAHSIQTLGDRTAVLNDLDLIAIIGLMVDEVKESPDRFPVINRVVLQWAASLRGYGPGTIELNLEAIAGSPEALSELKMLLSSVNDRVRSLGDRVPAPLLNHGLPAPGVTLSDYDSQFLIQAMDKLRQLLAV